MSNDARRELNKLLELETRHDDLLQRLEALDRRIAAVLANYGQPPAAATGVTPEAFRRAA